jgi:glycosyl transferase, family 25
LWHGVEVPTLKVDATIGLPIVYINLDEDAARREAMEQTLAQAGVHAVRLRAARWTRLAPTTQAQLYSAATNARQYHVPLVDGEKGCYTSHLIACEALLRSAHPALVVLEDDVRLLPAFASTLAPVTAATGSFDVLKLIQPGRDRLRAPLRLAGGRVHIGTFDRVPSFTAGQVLTRHGAQLLLKTRVPFGRPIDVDQRHWWENGLRIRGLMPSPIELAEASTSSSIWQQRTKTLPWAVRVKKLRWRLAYNIGNAWHARRDSGRDSARDSA